MQDLQVAAGVGPAGAGHPAGADSRWLVGQMSTQGGIEVQDLKGS
ncbi:hypothetical protein FHW79_005432 [Azospirillum sp. OGB3]|nr:hypothetical protein [Azospirillum sp. OGB3]MBB3267767.1 hypothetical protein [Azospirillum sp. OGB3]